MESGFDLQFSNNYILRIHFLFVGREEEKVWRGITNSKVLDKTIRKPTTVDICIYMSTYTYV